ncbi:MAG: hypothetical protein MKZ54_07135 [Candidatus Poseidoniaceae archaeon]|nr:hypothetical protein [Candidatus Poseidoniaceae archaeon]
MMVYVVESQSIRPITLAENTLQHMEEVLGGFATRKELTLYEHAIDSYMHSMEMGDIEKMRIIDALKPRIERGDVEMFFNGEGALMGLPINLYATILNGDSLVNGPAIFFCRFGESE